MTQGGIEHDREYRSDKGASDRFLDVMIVTLSAEVSDVLLWMVETKCSSQFHNV